MIETPTLFILGAGASKALGFPLGLQLRADIVNQLYTKGEMYNAIFDHFRYGIDQGESSAKPLLEIEAEIQQFRDALGSSRLYSIDAFLERNPKYQEIGKAAIAAALIPCEDESKLTKPIMNDPSWMDELFNRMDCDPDQYLDNQVRFITFNYDRSLEYYFMHSIKNTYDVPEQEAMEVVKQIPIVHIHGMLGQPHFADESGRKYENDTSREALRSAVDSMKIIYEQADNSPELQQAHGFMKWADVLCFLGFGYHPINMERLNVAEHFGGSILLGTCFELGENNRSLIGKHFEGAVRHGVLTGKWGKLRGDSFTARPLHLGKTNETILDLFADYPVFQKL